MEDLKKENTNNDPNVLELPEEPAKTEEKVSEIFNDSASSAEGQKTEENKPAENVETSAPNTQGQEIEISQIAETLNLNDSVSSTEGQGVISATLNNQSMEGQIVETPAPVESLSEAEMTKEAEPKSEENKLVENVETPTPVVEQPANSNENSNTQPNSSPVAEVQETINNDDIINAIDLPAEAPKPATEEAKQNIQDINISTIEDVLNLILKNKYDFVTFEPSDNEVKLQFRKDKVIVDTKFIRYNIYSNILLKAKQITKLVLDKTDEEQEGEGEIAVEDKNVKVVSKVVGSNFGEKLFLKATQVEKKEKKPAKKLSFGQMMTFLGITALVALIVGVGFLIYIVTHSGDPAYINLFYSLGISLENIKPTIYYINDIVFGILTFALFVFLIIFLFKFFLTPKTFKKKKFRNGVISVILFIIVFSNLTGWVYLREKIGGLPEPCSIVPNLCGGLVILYDNDKLINGFSEKDSRIQIGYAEDITSSTSRETNTINLVGPVRIKFDITTFANTLGIGKTATRFEWIFTENGKKGDPISTTEPYYIKEFDEKGTTEINVRIIGIDNITNKTDVVLKETSIRDIPNITIYGVVKYGPPNNEKILGSGGKQETFDAVELSSLGNMEWYKFNFDNTEEYQKVIKTGTGAGTNPYTYNGGKKYITDLFFDDTIFLMIIKRPNQEADIKRTFIIKGQNEANITGEIVFKRDITNDLKVTFSVKDAKSEYGGYIEKYIWKIGTTSATTTKTGDPYQELAEKSSEFIHTFTEYKDYLVSVELVDSAGESKTITQNIKLPKTLKLIKGMTIYSDGEVIKDVTYNSTTNEYFINYLGTPNETTFDTTTISLDALNKNLYTLQKVEWNWDSNENEDIDAEGKKGIKDIFQEGEYEITAYLTYKHRKTDEEIKVIQKIFFTAGPRDCFATFKFVPDSIQYAPAKIGLDGSSSSIKDGNIVRFTWDFGDGTTQNGGEGVIGGHNYSKQGEYDVKLTITSKEGKSCSVVKKLILNEAPQSVKIEPSMKKAPVGQGIDFISIAEGQVSSYHWDFGDGDISTSANPSHTFEKAGKYKVSLRVVFTNRNERSAEVEIEVN